MKTEEQVKSEKENCNNLNTKVNDCVQIKSNLNPSENLEKRFAKVFDILPIVEKIMPICPTDKYGRVYSWLDVNYMVFHKIKGWDEMLKTLAGLDII